MASILRLNPSIAGRLTLNISVRALESAGGRIALMYSVAICPLACPRRYAQGHAQGHASAAPSDFFGAFEYGGVGASADDGTCV
jgi:hypothetical protein